MITYPRWVSTVLSALLAACIQRSGRPYIKRRSYDKIISSAFTGMSAELALCLWFKSVGFNSTMSFPRLGPDEGWDVAIHGDEKAVTFDAKGSLFRDRRYIEHLRLGDKFRASARKHSVPNLYAWCILNPKSLDPTAERVEVGLVALLHPHLLHRGRSGMEITFAQIKEIPSCAPEAFLSAYLMGLADHTTIIIIPEPSSSRLATLIRGLIQGLGLVGDSLRRDIEANVLLDIDLMKETSRLLDSEKLLRLRV